MCSRRPVAQAHRTMESDPDPGGFVFGAIAHGIDGTDVVSEGVDFGRSQHASVDGRREVLELRPVGVRCLLPRANEGEKPTEVFGTARTLSVRYASSEFATTGHAVVSAVRLVAEPAPQDWAVVLNQRGALFVQGASPVSLDRFVLDDGLQEPGDLDLLGIAAHASGRLARKNSRFSASLRSAWVGPSVDAALVERGAVAGARSTTLSTDVGMQTAMSVMADLVFVSWLRAEADGLVPRILRGRIDPSAAAGTYLALDELFEVHRRSSHYDVSRRLLAAFDTEYQWMRLGRRIELAGLAQRTSSA